MLRKIASFPTILVGIIVLFGGGYFFGFVVGQETPKTIMVQGVSNLQGDASQAIDFSVFWQAWDILGREHLKHAEANDQKKVYGAIRGLVQSVGDPYTQYFTPADNTRFKEDVGGSFGGIGAELGMRDEGLTIIAPLKNTPASRAGLKSGDLIIKINSTSTENIQIDEAISFIRGPQNSTVTLSVFRKSWGKTKDFILNREEITLPTLDSEVLDENILYVHLHSFNALANKKLGETLQETLSQKPIGGIILDLRDNPGGYLEMAVAMANWFLPKGTLVVTEQGLKGKEEFRAEKEPPLKTIPIVVLINKGSASASEILAGALQAHKRAVLVGEQSYGKGTVQELKPLKDGSAIKMTVAHWVLPGGQILEGNGLKPDYVVTIPEELLNSSSSQKIDPQLNKAKEIIKPKITTLFRASS